MQSAVSNCSEKRERGAIEKSELSYGTQDVLNLPLIPQATAASTNNAVSIITHAVFAAAATGPIVVYYRPHRHNQI